LNYIYASSDESTQTQMQVITTSEEGSDTTERAGPGLGLGVEDKMPPKMRKRWIQQSAGALRDMSKSAGGSTCGDGERMEVDESGELSLRGYEEMIFILYFCIYCPSEREHESTSDAPTAYASFARSHYHRLHFYFSYPYHRRRPPTPHHISTRSSNSNCNSIRICCPQAGKSL
jgi:hypothetical protein